MVVVIDGDSSSKQCQIASAPPFYALWVRNDEFEVG